MKLKIFNRKFLNYNLFLYLFLIWNALILFSINTDPIIQILNLLLSIGIYFCIEDKNLRIKSKRNIDFLIGVVGICFTILRSLILNNVDDKYYYFNLPIGIFFLLIIFRPFNELIYLKKIFIISLLLPIRRIFFHLSNYILASLVPFLTWFILFALGVNPVLDGENIYVGSYQLIIGENCWGADNLYFVLSILIIYSCIFRLRKINNISLMLISSAIISISMNCIRNTILALILLSKISYKDVLFEFLHDSYGSLIFTFFSVLTISFLYFKLLEKELNFK